MYTSNMTYMMSFYHVIDICAMLVLMIDITSQATCICMSNYALKMILVVLCSSSAIILTFTTYGTCYLLITKSPTLWLCHALMLFMFLYTSDIHIHYILSKMLNMSLACLQYYDQSTRVMSSTMSFPMSTTRFCDGLLPQYAISCHLLCLLYISHAHMSYAERWHTMSFSIC